MLDNLENKYSLELASACLAISLTASLALKLALKVFTMSTSLEQRLFHKDVLMNSLTLCHFLVWPGLKAACVCKYVIQVVLIIFFG